MIKTKKITQDAHNSGSDRYLITYADLITLLLGLFVVLYASAQVDQEKFKEYSTAFSEYFKVKDNKVLQGGDGVLEGHRKGVPEPIMAPQTEKNISEMEVELKSKLSSLINNKSILIAQEDSTLRISMTEKLLFKSGSAQIELSGQKVLDTIALLLQGSIFVMFVDGHTDSDPIKTFQYESNWHLSSARATNVAYKMMSYGIPEYNLVIRAFGSQRPLFDNTTLDGKAKNRRVDILLVPPDNLTPTKKGYINIK